MKRTMVYTAVLAVGWAALMDGAPQGRGRGPQGPPAVQPQAQGRPPGQSQGQAPGQARAPEGRGPREGVPRAAQPRLGAVEFLERHPEQAARFEPMLPPGTDVNLAATGFKNFGLFVAVTHVSKNLNIPFEGLKAMTTGPDAMPLGKAIREFKPDLSNGEVKEAVKAAKRAEKEARKAAKEQKRRQDRS